MGPPRRTPALPSTKASQAGSPPPPSPSLGPHSTGNASGSHANSGSGSNAHKNRPSLGAHRRTAGNGAAAAAGFVPPPLVSQPSDARSTSGNGETEGIDFPSLPRETLHAYRHAFKLSTPSSSKTFANTILTQPFAAGSVSRNGVRKRASKEALARDVRKNFNAMGCSESEVIVWFMYAASVGDRKFRLRYPRSATR